MRICEIEFYIKKIPSEKEYQNFWNSVVRTCSIPVNYGYTSNSISICI